MIDAVFLALKYMFKYLYNIIFNKFKVKNNNYVKKRSLIKAFVDKYNIFLFIGIYVKLRTWLKGL